MLISSVTGLVFLSSNSTTDWVYVASNDVYIEAPGLFNTRPTFIEWVVFPHQNVSYYRIPNVGQCNGQTSKIFAAPLRLLRCDIVATGQPYSYPRPDIQPYIATPPEPHKIDLPPDIIIIAGTMAILYIVVIVITLVL